MAYATQSDLVMAAGGSEKLIQLADQDPDGEIDAGVVAKAIADADIMIDSYAQKRYSVPFDPVPRRVSQLSAELAIYYLKRRRNADTDHDRDDHVERIAWLENLAKGVVSVGLEPMPTKSSQVVPEVLERSDKEDISRASLKGFW